MIHDDENALICDLAEVYHIYDYRSLPVRLVATLAAGLGPNSRVYQKLAGQTVPTDTLLLAMLVDDVRAMVYGTKGKHVPERIAPKLMAGAIPERKERIFKTGADFDKARAALLNGELTDGN